MTTPVAFSARKVARMLGVSHRTVGRMVADGRLASVDCGTRTHVIPRWSIEKLLGRPLDDVVGGQVEVVREGSFS